MSRLANELDALRSIYEGLSPEELVLTIILVPTTGPAPNESASGDIEVRVQVQGGLLSAVFSLPRGYPDEGVTPQLSVTIGGDSSYAQASIMRELSVQLEQLLEQETGNEVLFLAIEMIRSRVSDHHSHDEEEKEDERSGPTVAVAAAPTTTTLDIHNSAPLVERKSTFIAHVCRVESIQEVQEFRSYVLSDRRNARATHNIFAYRFTCKQTGVSYNDCDDDGETAAGARLGEMLRLMGLKSGAAVIVTRWFGGVLLGPDRFKFINNCARHLLEEKGFV